MSSISRLSLLLAGLLLTACGSSPSQMRSSNPDHMLSSTRTPKAVAICIADEWEKTRTLGADIQVSVRETALGFSVSMSLGGNLHYLADIEQRPGGSVSKLYIRKVISVGANPAISAISSCQM